MHKQEVEVRGMVQVEMIDSTCTYDMNKHITYNTFIQCMYVHMIYVI